MENSYGLLTGEDSEKAISHGIMNRVPRRIGPGLFGRLGARRVIEEERRNSFQCSPEPRSGHPCVAAGRFRQLPRRRRPALLVRARKRVLCQGIVGRGRQTAGRSMPGEDRRGAGSPRRDADRAGNLYLRRGRATAAPMVRQPRPGRRGRKRRLRRSRAVDQHRLERAADPDRNLFLRG